MKPIHFVVLALLAAVFAETLVSNTALQITRLTVRSKNCPTVFNGFKIVQLSDLHSKQFGRDNTRLLSVVADQSPDIIVLTGDMVDRLDKDYGIFFDLSASLVKICPVYYIMGNHEHSKDAKSIGFITNHLERTGVRILYNERVLVTKDKHCVSLFGFNSYLKSYDPKLPKLSARILEEILGSPDPSELNILLAHNPVYFNAYTEWGADLTLCGHMHGGMIRLPLLGAVFSPEKALFPKYGEGVFRELQNTMVVNRGLGNGRVGFRFFNRPEITVITLKSA